MVVVVIVIVITENVVRKMEFNCNAGSRIKIFVHEIVCVCAFEGARARTQEMFSTRLSHVGNGE